MSDRKNVALYRDSEGSSALHDAIENRQYTIALNLLQKFPSLALVKDIVSQRTFAIYFDVNLLF